MVNTDNIDGAENMSAAFTDVASTDNLSDKIALKSLTAIEFVSGKDLVQNRLVVLNYSGHFNNYNANVRYSRTKVEFNLSRLWKNVDEDIQKGLIESLIVRMYKLRGIKTPNMLLYENFMKGLSKYAKKHRYDPQIEKSFNRVNEKFFEGMMEKPNLVFGNETFRKLGSYEYGTDTVYISTIFKDLPEDTDDKKYLDYVVYHELLHKKHTFNVKNGRHQAHTTAFRNDERKFGITNEDVNVDMEKELNNWLRRKRSPLKSVKSIFKFW
jgi:predicted metal-dependent hydrolase